MLCIFIRYFYYINVNMFFILNYRHMTVDIETALSFQNADCDIIVLLFEEF